MSTALVRYSDYMPFSLRQAQKHSIQGCAAKIAIDYLKKGNTTPMRDAVIDFLEAAKIKEIVKSLHWIAIYRHDVQESEVIQ